MRLFPSRNVFDRYLIIGIGFCATGYIQHNHRREQAFRWDLVDCPQSGSEMRGCIQVRSEMLGQGNLAGEVAVLGDGRDYGRAKCGFLGKLVSRNLCINRMGEIENLMESGTGTEF